jgi:hypothetical protein
MRVRHYERLGVFGYLVLLLLLAACAPAGGSTSAGAQPVQASPTAANASPTPAPSPTPGSPQLNGCPAKQPPAGAQGHAADVVVTERGTEDSQPITLTTGQTLEVRLPAIMRWRMILQDTSAVLSTNEATGWYDATLKDCRWLFTALKAGGAALSFTGTMVCAPKSECPTVAILQQYTVTVH